MVLMTTDNCKIHLMNMTLQTHATKIEITEVIPLPRETYEVKEAVYINVQLEDIHTTHQ